MASIAGPQRPAVADAGRYALSDLGPCPVHEARLAAGAWTIWWLLASLAVAPVKAVLGLGLAARVDPWRVLRGELDVSFGFRPAAEILASGLLVAVVVGLRRLSLTQYGGSLLGSVLLYAAAGGTGLLSAVALGWIDLLDFDSPAGLAIAVACVGVPALLGAWQWRVRTRRGPAPVALCAA